MFRSLSTVFVDFIKSLLVILVWLGCLWLSASLATSVIKAARDDCGKTYGIEVSRLGSINGNFFCEVK